MWDYGYTTLYALILSERTEGGHCPQHFPSVCCASRDQTRPEWAAGTHRGGLPVKPPC